MSQTLQKYAISFTFIHCDAYATVEVKAYDEAHAVRLAQSTLSKELCPTLHHIQLNA